MDISFLLGIVLVFLVLKATKTITVCQPKRKELCLEFTNTTLVGRLLAAPVAMEEIFCQYSCHANDFCDAYNFNTNTDQCELLDGRASSFNIENKQDWKFRAQKCEANPCLNGGTCFHAMGKDTCMCPCDYKGELCEEHIPNLDLDMSFPGGSVKDLVVLENPFPPVPLGKLSVSMRLQMDPAKAGKHALLSYYTKSVGDAIAVMLDSTTTYISINQNWRAFTDPSQLITDSNWHHLLFTWENYWGRLVLYIDGVKRGEKVVVARQTTIDPRGALVLGQDQDSYIGGYDAQQALKGNLTSLNMWDKVLTASEITADLSTNCTAQEGNILTWTTLGSQPRQRNVKLICSPSDCVTP